MVLPIGLAYYGRRRPPITSFAFPEIRVSDSFGLLKQYERQLPCLQIPAATLSFQGEASVHVVPSGHLFLCDHTPGVVLN
jgi:hypothetical protein